MNLAVRFVSVNAIGLCLEAMTSRCSERSFSKCILDFAGVFLVSADS
jgi:hypothetical protein